MWKVTTVKSYLRGFDLIISSIFFLLLSFLQIVTSTTGVVGVGLGGVVGVGGTVGTCVGTGACWDSVSPLQRCNFSPDLNLGRALRATSASPSLAPPQMETIAPTADTSASSSNEPY